ncbi:MAG: OmpA family protein [Thiobacillus sp.]|uniref:OmpA family protein n=1 Tax=Thiobacillus sp. TaxID=924 RepID=UPI0027355142|nr:OmpA family protein [Thiobacillus sp.]MDP3585253.1 OmpA family protein [Thiobacillus sp.]
MKTNRYLPLSLIAAAMLAGCSTMPSQNTALEEARSVYSSARTNPQVTSLAPLELQKAGESLNKADAALSKGDSDVTVNQLAYLTKQQVAIAQETAKRKAAEQAVVNASAQRDQVRLAARTAEADAAKRQVAKTQAEVDEARRQAAIAQENADRQAAALAAANAQAQRDEALIAARQAEAEEARRQAELARQSAEQQAAAYQARIAEQEQKLKELDAKKTERGMVITLGDVLFAVNRAELSAGGMRNVQKLADFLTQYPQRKVLIEGHTDSTGSRSINQPLSERRADAVRSALAGMGISGDRIETRGYAETYPVASNNTAAGRQLNRRVEIILSDDNGNIVPR